MAKIKFDTNFNPISPTLILAKRNGDKIGRIPAMDISVKDTFENGIELSFKVYKFLDDILYKDWDQLLDFKLVYIKEWDRWTEIKVQIDDSDQTTLIKNVTASSLGIAELSQVNLYNVEINTEEDIKRDDYVPTILYNPDNKNASLLDRILYKTPHYTIKYVDETIRNIQRTFTFDKKDLRSCFNEIEQEIECKITIDDGSDNKMRPIRAISVYDLDSNCKACGYRGDFSNICPKCGSSNIINGYGKDSGVFISTENIAESITFTSNTDSLKNCFRLEAGDDLMTATVMNCNPNGSQYIWKFSNINLDDMSQELKDRLKKYQEDYDYYCNHKQYKISDNIRGQYNTLVQKYSSYLKDRISPIPTELNGYNAISQLYYNTIDFKLFLESELMPQVEYTSTTAQKEAAKLTSSSMSPIATTTLSVASGVTISNIVSSCVKSIISPNYRITVNDYYYENYIWYGTLTLTSYSDEKDKATTGNLVIKVNDDYKTYVNQLLQKTLSKSADEFVDILTLFKMNSNNFAQRLKLYGLHPLEELYGACQSTLDIMIENGDSSPTSEIYSKLYVPYYTKLELITSEIKIREQEIGIIYGIYNQDNVLVSNGVQPEVISISKEINSLLDIENYLKDYWKEFISYRREDVYSNSNYVSDGLNNAEIFEKAREFYSKAETEISKASVLQHSISGNLKNFLVMKEFQPIVDNFEVGNWIRIRTDGNIYLLRLVEYTIEGFESTPTVNVAFSDVTYVDGSINDISSILSNAKSMSSSFNNVSHNASVGSKNAKYVNTWFEDGLSITQTKLQDDLLNSNMTWDSHGLTFRHFDPYTQEYDSQQMKIYNSTLAVTDDNWETTKTAVGKIYYKDPETNEIVETYGINAETIVGNLLLGTRLGIYTNNGKMSFDESGLQISNGVNSFSVDPNSKKLLKISNGDKDIFYVDENGALHLTAIGTDIDISENEELKNYEKKTDLNNTLNSYTKSNEVRSKFAMDSTNIDIESGKINFKSNCITIDSENFKLGENGEVEATGTFKTTVESTNGYKGYVQLSGFSFSAFRNDKRAVYVGSVADETGTGVIQLMQEGAGKLQLNGGINTNGMSQGLYVFNGDSISNKSIGHIAYNTQRKATTLRLATDSNTTYAFVYTTEENTKANIAFFDKKILSATATKKTAFLDEIIDSNNNWVFKAEDSSITAKKIFAMNGGFPLYWAYSATLGAYVLSNRETIN